MPHHRRVDVFHQNGGNFRQHRGNGKSDDKRRLLGGRQIFPTADFCKQFIRGKARHAVCAVFSITASKVFNISIKLRGLARNASMPQAIAFC